MNNQNQTQVVKDLPNKKITVIREFNAARDLVWRAWTESELLDQWWAPKPWKTETKTMDFRVGGHWLYAMVGPDGEKHWAKADYQAVNPITSFELQDSFCDEHGNKTNEAPSIHWVTSFANSAGGTMVTCVINFKSEEDLKEIIKMGFQEGFTAAHSNLDQYLAAQSRLRNELKTDNKSRVTTYLNFPGNTEEAFNFYKSVFGNEFSGKGIQHFGNIPADAGHPPIQDNIKKMVLHVELPTIGEHVLMGTDAPEEMGFKLTPGNNMHICLEPETRKETEKLFNGLSAGGKVTMPLKDMFFGAYFGEFQDKYGINWMVSCREAII